MFRNTKSDISVLLTTFFLTILVDISIAIQFGLVLAAFLFVKRVSETSGINVLNTPEDISAHTGDEARDEELSVPAGVEVFQIRRPFFFGIANKIDEAEKQLGQKSKVRIIRMRLVPFIDSTGLKNLESFIHKTQKSGIHVIISGVQNKKIQYSLEKAGIIDKIGKDNVCPEIQSAFDRARRYIAEHPF